MRAIYFDCFAGISGDMIVGALVDLGLDPDDLISELKKLPVEGFRVELSDVEKQGIRAKAFRVYLEHETGERLADVEFRESAVLTPDAGTHAEHHSHTHTHAHTHAHNHLSEILECIEQSKLSERVRSQASAIFNRLGAAEAKVHGVPLEKVHLHEVGGLDAIVDITSAAIGLEKLGVDAVLASPLHLGGGFVRTSHGVLPVPAPATAELLAGAQVYTTEISGELVTPTGAAILMNFIQRFGPLPRMHVLGVGYGAGSRDRSFPNVLRAYLGELPLEEETVPARLPRFPHQEQHNVPLTPAGYQEGLAVVLESNIDDSNPQMFEYLMDRLFEAGALDVGLLPISMKKTRPGVALQVMAHPENVDDLLRIIFEESTTIGVRSYPVTKHMLPRQIETVETEFGSVRVKIARLGAKVVNVKPEYEDCRALAIQLGLPIKEVYLAAMNAVSRQNDEIRAPEPNKAQP
ncbi:MAG: nickel pincer cofactor biosynthesis protein LarC [Anaerolineales bacterium]|nr:nickel pincer cofactor biosynthesis protein LarC [Anaerolineales bacterium]